MIYPILSFKKNLIMPLAAGGLPVLRLIKKYRYRKSKVKIKRKGNSRKKDFYASK